MSATLSALALRAATFAAAFVAWLCLVVGQMNATSAVTRWTIANYHEKERAASSAREPRILLVGGSSAMFGLRADDMTAALGMPVINFGNHAGLGPAYILHRADRWVRRGDIVVLALEYELYSIQSWNTTLAEFVLADDPAYFFRQPWREIVRTVLWMDVEHLLKGYGILALPDIHLRTSVYGSAHLDGYGDTLGNLPFLRPPHSRESVLASPPISPAASERNLQLLRGYIRGWRERGARTIAIAPPLLDRDAYHQPPLEAAFAALPPFYAAAGAPMPLAPAAAMYTVENFFDSWYHLDAVAARMHTARVIEAIRPWVPMPGQPTAWRPPEPDHALAGMQRRYGGWLPVAGLSGPDTDDWSRPPMYSSVPGRALVTARTATPGTARLHALVASKSEDILHIAVADRPAWRCGLAGNARTTIDLPLGSVADGAPIAIEHGVALEIEELRISWPAAGAASGPCAAEASRPR